MENRIDARIQRREFEGRFWQVFFDAGGGEQQLKLSMVNDGAAVARRPGQRVTLGFAAELAVATPAGPLAAG